MKTLEELDSLDNYEIIGDETELKWFYDNCVPKPLQSEAFAFCLSSRNKRLSEEERKNTGLGRSEMMDPNIAFPDADGKMTYSRWKKAIRKYECNKESYTNKEGKPFLAKTLVCYYYCNPTDELGVIKSIKEYINIHEQELVDSAMKTDLRAKALDNIVKDLLKDEKLTSELKERVSNISLKSENSGVRQSTYKLCKSLTKMKRLQFDNCGTKWWVDFDMDIKDKSQKELLYENWNNYCKEKLGKGNFIIIETGGGFHTLVKKRIIKFNPDRFTSDFCNAPSGVSCHFNIAFIGELAYNKNYMIPCPGTYQYGNVVRIRNKEDYVIDQDMIKEEY